MKRKLKKKYRLIFIVAPISIFVIVVAILFITKDQPPLEEMEAARGRLSEAKAANAAKYSKNLYNSACSSYDSAMRYWKVENDRFYLFRNYDQVKYYALKAEKYAASSIGQADNNSKSLKKEIEDKIDRIQKKINIYHANFEKMPSLDETRKQYNKGKIYFGEANLAFQKSDYIKAQQKIDLSAKLIEKSYNYANNVLVNYFGNFTKWQRWVSMTIEQSRLNDSYCIIVDKFSRECLLYYKGALKEKYEIDLGKNWMGDKNHQGDYTTPEGIYKVIDKKNCGRTTYYKAMLLNYPNEEDKARFAMNKKNGTISSWKRIGDLIEIHGEGGKGADWTSGCIALSNPDMDRIFAKCPNGTTVTIVGSLKPYSELMKIP